MAWKVLTCLRDYCANCTLAGVCHIANRNLHYTERVFWLICVVLSALGSYKLISQFERDFESKAVSIVYESVTPNEKIRFPSVALCDTFIKHDVNLQVEAYVDALYENDYNYDVESYVVNLLYPHLYHAGIIKGKCAPYETCEQCAKCPLGGYRELIDQFAINCSSFFVNCSLAGKPFDCCQYFLPLTTPFGKCFLMNSLQNNKPGSGSWFPNLMEQSVGATNMTLVTNRPMEVRIMNEEDIPYENLAGIAATVTLKGQHKVFLVYVENMINDPDVREVSPEFRKCRFPDEVLPNAGYKYYSFSACLVDCIRVEQLRACNCTLYNLLPEPRKSIRECGYEGYMCLEGTGMLQPNIKLFLPWANNNFTCECLPSCTEHDLSSISEYNLDTEKRSTRRTVTIHLPQMATERYRRQALRTRLDVVVTIGGIMGLFMGASILSAIEFLYYFTLRLFNDVQSERAARLKATAINPPAVSRPKYAPAASHAPHASAQTVSHSSGVLYRY